MFRWRHRLCQNRSLAVNFPQGESPTPHFSSVGAVYPRDVRIGRDNAV
jgi:hypothetical protein